MRASQWYLNTLRETPADAELVSHQLMLRTGMIKKLGSGLYSWMPLGLKVLRKVEHIIREEMNRIGAMELLMPCVQPAELWQETKRWESFGGQLLTMTDSNKRDYCFGPTHEEVITDIMRNELSSYKQLPLCFYQIQTKFRDEIRPRFGVMRAREFLMKDAYSFHLSEASLETTYQQMYHAYSTIFSRLGLTYRAVQADTGAIGGSASHEFQVLADSGEDFIFYSSESDYAANIEQAVSATPKPSQAVHDAPLTLVDTQGLQTIKDVAKHLHAGEHELVKTLVVEGEKTPFVALVLKGDDALNEIKAQKHPLVKSPLRFATDEQILSALNAPVGSLGPIGLSIPVIVDHHALAMTSFICGANKADKHFTNACWARDVTELHAFDLRNVKAGEKSPDGKGQLTLCRGIEVGHIFQLGSKYAEAMSAKVLDESGKAQTMTMGCYGIGVSRVVAAAIEQHHDERGIIWPKAIAPFDIVIIPVNGHRSERVRALSEQLYEQWRQLGLDVLLDDRKERPGVLFADNDLIGIPHRIVVSERLLDEHAVEYKSRSAQEPQHIPMDKLTDVIKHIGDA